MKKKNIHKFEDAEPGQKTLIDLCDNAWFDQSIKGLSTQQIKTTIRAVVDTPFGINMYPNLEGIYVHLKSDGSISFHRDVYLQEIGVKGFYGFVGYYINKSDQKKEFDLQRCKVTIYG